MIIIDNNKITDAQRRIDQVIIAPGDTGVGSFEGTDIA